MSSKDLASAILAPIRAAIYALFSLTVGLAVMVALLLSGCSTKPVIQTHVVEKPVPVFCNVTMPEECKDAYAVDRISPADSPVTINRALRQEIEERAACEVKLRAAVMGCNSVKHEDQAHP
jgi:hypothetical protein